MKAGVKSSGPPLVTGAATLRVSSGRVSSGPGYRFPR